MTKASSHTAFPQPGQRAPILWALGILVVAIGVAYHNSFSGPFVFDDIYSITENPSIRQFSTAWRPMPGMGGVTVAGRPVVNLSLALNYAISGEAVWSYHALNVLIHCANAGLLLGIVQATLRQPVLRDRFESVALPVATATAMLWALHPLQTESVTYVIQRAESLMALFYLLTLYAFIRSVGSDRARLWQAVAIAGCLAGMATKEVMASTPLIVLLYDRTFVSATFRKALRQRAFFYLSLGGTWLVLLALVLSTSGRGGTAGFNVDITWWKYALTQSWAVVHYLQLSAWPDPLVFDYGMWVVTRLGDVWLQTAILLILIAATLWALRRNSVWGFLGAFFFAILAPSSSIVPVATQTVAEHRMYLPLASVMVVVTLAGYAFMGRKGWWVLVAVLAVAYGALTIRRNEVYRGHVALWADTAAKRPDNAFAHYNLALSLQGQGNYAEAVPEYEAAIRLIPDYIEAHTNLGTAFQQLGRWEEAEKQYQIALRYDSRPVETLVNLGGLLLARQRWEEAGRVYAKLLELDPERLDACINIAHVLFALGREADALDQLEVALQGAPDSADIHFQVALVLVQWRQYERARQQLEIVLQLRPGDTKARESLARLASLSR